MSRAAGTTGGGSAAARAAAVRGSIKVRHTARGINIRATGAAAALLAGAVHATLAGSAGTPLTTVHFCDEGQPGALEWDLDAAGVVVAARPCPGEWLGARVRGAISPGEYLLYDRPGTTLPVQAHRWRVAAVHRSWR